MEIILIGNIIHTKTLLNVNPEGSDMDIVERPHLGRYFV